jgi:hypothetical protein
MKTAVYSEVALPVNEWYCKMEMKTAVHSKVALPVNIVGPNQKMNVAPTPDGVACS